MRVACKACNKWAACHDWLARERGVAYKSEGRQLTPRRSKALSTHLNFSAQWPASSALA